jgi:hypothetical protein
LISRSKQRVLQCLGIKRNPNKHVVLGTVEGFLKLSKHKHIKDVIDKHFYLSMYVYEVASPLEMSVYDSTSEDGSNAVILLWDSDET